ncbi:MFS transporter [bacterium]|nr:MFS transporter [bacterium]
MIRKNQKSVINHKMLLFFLGGLSNGLPGVLTWQTLSIWMRQLGYSNSIITLMFLTGLPYTFKFLLSPIVDHYHPPFLKRYFGKRCGWAIAMQVMMLLSLIGLGTVGAQKSLLWTGFFCFITSLCASINQTATVAHRIEILNDDETPQAVAIGIMGYRIGKLIGHAGALYLMSYLPWHIIYYSLSFVLVLSIALYTTTPEQSFGETKSVYEPKVLAVIQKKHPFVFKQPILVHLYCTIAIPFLYFRKNNTEWKKILGLLLLINIGDDLILGITDLFFLDLGFSPIQIANIAKVFGLFCSISGGLLAAALARHYHLIRTLGIAAIARALSHLLLILLSLKGADPNLLILTVTAEYFTSGMKAALIATLISNLCSRLHHTGSQYAFFSSIKAIPLIITSSLSGLLIDRSSWPIFFIVSFFLSLPGIMIVFSIPNNSIKKSSYNDFNMLRLTQFEKSLENA